MVLLKLVAQKSSFLDWLRMTGPNELYRFPESNFLVPICVIIELLSYTLSRPEYIDSFLASFQLVFIAEFRVAKFVPQ